MPMRPTRMLDVPSCKMESLDEKTGVQIPNINGSWKPQQKAHKEETGVVCTVLLLRMYLERT